MTKTIKNLGRGYSGKEKMKLYHYSTEGKFLKTFNSIEELRKEYFPNDLGRRPLFRGDRWDKFKYNILPDNTFYSNYRIGRDKLLQFEKIINSSYCFNKATDNKELEVFNLLNEKIASFKNIHIASLMTKINKVTIFHSCNEGKGFPKGEIYFKYTDETGN